MWLTGRPSGPPLLAPGRPAALLQDELDLLRAALDVRADGPTVLPGVELLGERAASAGLSRHGPLSPGGSFRVLPTRDGWIGLSLARPSDVELVPALVASDDVADPWHATADWAAGVTTEEAAERISLLGLPGQAVPDPAGHAPTSTRPAVVATPGGRRRTRARPLVVDFSALWAGPLCAHLLGLGGADVVKVESVDRLDGARRGPRDFYDLLHHGHRSAAVDFGSATDREALLRLVRGADVVVEASRPRALRHLGLRAEELAADGVVWVSITAAGRDSDAVGFGDDVAAGAGLVVANAGDLLPCGDALADPLTGVVAARHAAQALLGDRGAVLDVSMRHTCLEARADSRIEELAMTRDADGEWWVDSGGWVLVARPTARRPAGPAAAPGAHTAEVLR
jgi:hypothetical protein